MTLGNQSKCVVVLQHKQTLSKFASELKGTFQILVVYEFYVWVAAHHGSTDELLPDSSIVNLVIGDPAHEEGYM